MIIEVSIWHGLFCKPVLYVKVKQGRHYRIVQVFCISMFILGSYYELSMQS